LAALRYRKEETKTIAEIKEKLRNIEPNQLKNDKSKPPFPTPPSFDTTV
jgi:hypothetical protein